MNVAVHLMNRVVVFAYKITGFVVLAGILAGTASYIGLQLFYLVSASWVVPVIVSSHDERAVRAQTQLFDQEADRGRMQLKLLTLNSEVQDAQRRLDMERAFQNGFGQAVSADVSQRRGTVKRLQGLAQRYDELRPVLENSDPATAARAAEHARTLLDARLIDEVDFLQRGIQASHMAQTHLALTESRITLDDRVNTLARGITALQGDAPGSRPTYDALLMRRELQRSQAEAERAESTMELLQQHIEDVQDNLTRRDALLESLAGSPYLRAMSRRVTLAFVPYRNSENLESGQAVYGCLIGPLWCKEVGRILSVIDGEVTGHHPLSHDELRGMMIDLQMEESWAQRPVLYLRKAPLFT